MAQRRMMSLHIIDTDAFMDMSHSAQCLYMHLLMRADDDGFVANVKKVMRMVGVQDDDLKILFAKKYILPFESGVCVIKHWKIHNYIQSDRYNPTKYTDEMEQLLVKDNGAYTLDTECIQNGYNMDTQVRLGKVRLGKVKSVVRDYSPEFEQFWKEYPKKVGKGGAYRAWNKAKLPPLAEILTAVANQKNSDQWSRENGRYIPNPETWINQGRWDDEVNNKKDVLILK